MLIVVLLTLSLLITMISHSIAIVLVWLGLIIIVSYIGLWKFHKKNIILSLVIVVISWLAVVMYDVRMERFSSLMVGRDETISISSFDTFLVTSKTRMGRYILQSYPEPSHTLLLYSTQSLLPGDVISINKNPVLRSYRPHMCRWICKNTTISSQDILGDMINSTTVIDSNSTDRQDGQVVDNADNQSSLILYTIRTYLNSLFEDKEFDYDGRLYMQGIDGSLYDNTTKLIEHQSIGTFVEVRNSLFHTLTDKFGETIQAGLILGMTIGDRSLINEERYEQFIDSGLVHLIAVSGGNIAIVVLFVGMILFWVPFYIRQVVMIGAVIGYACIVGGDTSVIRATIMGLLTMIALFPGRQISIWRSLGYARCGMLLYNPYYLLYDMGFLLSFGAIIGIVWGERKYNSLVGLKEKQSDLPASRTNSLLSRLKKGFHLFIVLYIVPTIGAIVGVLPLLLRSMGQINIATPLVNILIVPLVPLITIVGCMVGILPLGWLSSIGEWFLSIAMEYILWLSVIGTRYAVMIEVVPRLQILLLLGVIVYWIRWIDTQKE